MSAPDDDPTAGVYAAGPDGKGQLVHAYDPEGDYVLADIPEAFDLGSVEHALLSLSRHELRQLKAFADSQSFDYEEGFIEMCHEICRFADTIGQEPVRLWSVQ